MSIPYYGKLSHIVINNGIDTENIFHKSNFDYIKSTLNLNDEKVILHVTASFADEDDNIKGEKYIIELANRLKDRNIKIIVIASSSKKMNLPKNIICIGRITNQNELAAYYNLADLTIITSRKETFSMSVAESLACGTPVCWI